MPRWVKQPPWSTQYIYSVGWCKKTYFPEDAIDCARKNAVIEAALTIAPEVYSLEVMEEVQGASSLYQEHEVLLPVELLKKLLQEAEVLATWKDTEGDFGEKDSTYVLVRFPRKVLSETLVDELKKRKLSSGEAPRVSCAGSLSPFKRRRVIQAEGICPKTFYLRDGLLCARKKALAEISKNIALTITNEILDFSSTSESIIYVITEFVSAAVITGARVRKTFTDRDGNIHVIVEISSRDLLRSLKHTSLLLSETEHPVLSKIASCLISVLGR